MTKRFRTGEIVDVCKVSGGNYQTTVDGDVRWVKEANVAIERKTDNGGLCFVVDLQTGIEAGVFADEHEFHGMSRWHGESLTYGVRVSADIAATIGMNVSVCPIVRRRFVVRPDKDSRPLKVQKMAVRNVVGNSRVEGAGWELGLSISVTPNVEVKHTVGLEAYCLDQDLDMPSAGDNLVVDNVSTNSYLNGDVGEVLATEFPSTYYRGRCVWMASNSATFIQKENNEHETAQADFVRLRNRIRGHGDSDPAVNRLAMRYLMTIISEKMESIEHCQNHIDTNPYLKGLVQKWRRLSRKVERTIN